MHPRLGVDNAFTNVETAPNVRLCKPSKRCLVRGVSGGGVGEHPRSHEAFRCQGTIHFSRHHPRELSMVLPWFFRTKEGINLEALPTKEGMQVGVLLFRPDNQRVLGLKTAADARTLFKVCECVCNSSRGVPKQQ